MDKPLADQQREDLRDIGHLLEEACAHYDRRSNGRFAHAFVDFSWNNGPGHGSYDESLTVKSVTIYSYVFSPESAHVFTSTTEALEMVRGWHAQEMATEDDKEA